MKPDWLKRLEAPDNNAEFSQLCHDYFKLASMRVMQKMRADYSVPPHDIPTLTLAIFARFLNDACYCVGAAIKNGMKLNEILDREQLLILLTILNGDPLDPLKRKDIETDIQTSINKFKTFIMQNGEGFRL